MDEELDDFVSMPADTQHPHYEAIQLAHGLGLAVAAVNIALDLLAYAPEWTTMELWNAAVVGGLWGTVAWGIVYAVGVFVGLIFNDLTWPRPAKKEAPIVGVSAESAIAYPRQASSGETITMPGLVWEETDFTEDDEWSERHVVGDMFRVSNSMFLLPDGVTFDRLRDVSKARAEGKLPVVSERGLAVAEISRFAERGASNPAKAMIDFLIKTDLLESSRKDQVHQWTELGRRTFPSPTPPAIQRSYIQSSTTDAQPLGGSDDVYFVKSGGYVKIGVSNDIPRRMKDLQTGSAETLELLHTESGSFDREAELHQQFDAYRVNGEWFQLSNEIIDYIKDNRTGE